MRWIASLRSLVLGVVLSSLPALTWADVRIPAVFSENMVLQRDAANPIWGWADSGEEVSVTFAGSTVTTTAGKAGRWKVMLSRFEANRVGRPLSVRGSSGSQVTVQNVLVGDVWFFCGPSNLYWPVQRCDNANEEITAADFPDIRFFTVPKRLADQPAEDCEGEWVTCSPDTVGAVSGVAYFFSRRIHQDTDVPIGVLQSFWGGTRVEGWTSAEAVANEPALTPVTQWWKHSIADFDLNVAQQQHQRALEKWEQTAAEAKRTGQTVPKQPRRAANPALSVHRPGRLFNGMVAPLIPFGIRGAVTYPGLGNLHWAQYSQPLMSTMFRDWRRRWGRGDFPIGMVQPAPFPCDQWSKQHPDAYSLLRETQLKLIRELPNLGIATTMDVDDVTDLHFRNKQMVGHRMALWALANVYSQPIVHSGPTYESMTTEGDSIRVRFRHTLSGLTTSDGAPPSEFTIAGEDGRFYPAQATIDGDTVIVRSDRVPKPTAVRFAWSDTAVPNLINHDKLPASIFRTD